jgi:hypothetical protein
MCVSSPRCPAAVARDLEGAVDIENVYGRAGNLTFAERLDEGSSRTIGPLEVFTSRADGFIKPSSDFPTRPRVRLLSTRWMVRISACRDNSSLETQRAPLYVAEITFGIVKRPWPRNNDGGDLPDEYGRRVAHRDS